MDIIAKIDRTLLDNELHNLVRFCISRDSDRALFKPTYKIEIDDSCPYFIIREIFCYAGGYHISIVIYKGQIRFTIDRSVSNRSVESSLYEYEDPSLYKLFSKIIKLIKDKCDKNATKTR